MPALAALSRKSVAPDVGRGTTPPALFTKAARAFRGALPLLLLSSSLAAADVNSWLVSPTTGDWNTGTNWTSGIAPNAATATATFNTSGTTTLSISAQAEVSAIEFNAGASAFTITAAPGLTLTLSGSGITNGSGINPTFVIAVNGAGSFGQLFFTNSSTAGIQTAVTNNGATVGGGIGGITTFFNTSTAGSGAYGGSTVFRATSSSVPTT